MEILSYFYQPSMYYEHVIYHDPLSSNFTRHSHNSYQLLYFIQGDVTYNIENNKYKLKRGDLVIVHPQRSHYVELQSSLPYERYALHFDKKIIKNLALERFFNNLEICDCSSKNNIIAENFKKIDFYLKNFNEKSVAHLITLLIKEIFYNLSLYQNVPQTLPISNTVITQALSYIRENLFTIKSINEISEELFVSENYFFNLFKRELRITPKQYIIEKRLLAAQNMISLGEKPTDVCFLCGFTTYTSFYRNYIKYFGCSPSTIANTNTKDKKT